jgi:dephospho-CoA kinase
MKKTNNQKSEPPILAIVGALAVGKDTMAQYLVQHYPVMAIEVGAFARQLFEETAEEKSFLGYDIAAKRLTQHGPEYVMERLISEMIENSFWHTDALVITGVQTPAEAAVLKDQFGSQMLLADIRMRNQTLRYNRLLQRNLASDPDSAQEIRQQDEELQSKYDLAETFNLTDITLWNDGSLEEFYQQIETQIVPFLFPAKSAK